MKYFYTISLFLFTITLQAQSLSGWISPDKIKAGEACLVEWKLVGAYDTIKPPADYLKDFQVLGGPVYTFTESIKDGHVIPQSRLTYVLRPRHLGLSVLGEATTKGHLGIHSNSLMVNTSKEEIRNDTILVNEAKESNDPKDTQIAEYFIKAELIKGRQAGEELDTLCYTLFVRNAFLVNYNFTKQPLISGCNFIPLNNGYPENWDVRMYNGKLYKTRKLKAFILKPSPLTKYNLQPAHLNCYLSAWIPLKSLDPLVKQGEGLSKEVSGYYKSIVIKLQSNEIKDLGGVLPRGRTNNE